MRNSLFTIIAFALITTGVSAQSSSTDFFFGYKKSTLTSDHSATLETLFEQHKGDSSTIKIISHCDSVGGSDYNVGLGQARVDLFVKFYTSKGISADRITEVNNGSNNPLAPNNTEEGREQNRRVIVQYFGSGEAPVAEAEPEDSAQADVVVAGDCSTDTIVNLTGGAMLKMNACEFAKYSSCLSVNIISTAAKLKSSNYTTMGMNGQVMSTAGIVEVKICEGTELENVMTVYVPVLTDCKSKVHPDLWTSFGKGVWNSRTAKAQIDSVNGKAFYVYTTKTSNEANFATHINEKPEFTVKSKKGLKLKEVTVYYACEMGVYRKTLEEPAKKMKIALPCPSAEVKFDIVAVDKEGKEVKLTNLSSLDIKSKGKQKSCETEGVKKCFYIYPEEK
ncbi:MAG: hypothetical protein ACJA0Q_000064 [Saprospiraceae bacterium]|jgi:hypothetical protein